MSARDAARALKRVAELRRLCLLVPHMATPVEDALLQRFKILAASPGSVTDADVEAVAAGWRRWWRLDEVELLRAMVAQLPADYIARDRQLASYAFAVSRVTEDSR